MRLVLGSSYADADITVYGKVNALAQRAEQCTAGVEEIAAFTGLSVSSVERALRRLGRPGPDGVVEVYTRRRTHSVSGTGQTALRWCRELDAEGYVWAPVAAADALKPRLHRLYLALRYAQAIGHQPTLTELAKVLRHHSGKRAGQPITDEAVSDLLDELEATGWISLERRGGYRGRHAVTVHDHPVHPADTPDPTPGVDDGSGADHEDGSLAYREDQELNDLRTTHHSSPSAVGEVQEVAREAAVDNSAAPPRDPGASRASRADRTYTGPTLQLSPRVWHVLEPVRHLLPGIRTWVLREVARAVGRQLSTGTDPERLRLRLQDRYAVTDVRDPGRWLLGAALKRWGCENPDCEAGRLWSTSEDCRVCAAAAAERARGRPPQPPPAPGWHECHRCRAPARDPLPAGLCRPCRTAA
ncbi:hypothetical protein [Streptomyces sp. DH37]|uniref:hypothetical protein n=1 Tax=Streptomyces sp. DH37 TaxID=3040122 RepID=UPI002442256B|nr:hypothetical protein [Streptomyces sp. DH37]MDG9703758.1 hypothetical protein [Streptomyces sp. DH37]